MCLLVISNHTGELEPARLTPVSCHINQLMDHARVAQEPVAYLQCRREAGFSAIGVKIGRYEPVFVTSNQGVGIPDGLIEFIVGHAPSEITLAGVGEWDYLERLRATLTRAGYSVKIEHSAFLPVSFPATDTA